MKILVIDDSGQAVSTKTIGTGSGSVMVVPAPLASMDLILSLPFNLVGTTLSINLATGSLPGLMTAAQFASIAALGTASTQATSAFDAAGAASTAQAFAIQRANQTGTQTASTISDFGAAAISAVTWSTLTGKPTFATVATSGAYSDLTGLPTLGTASTQATGAFATAAQGTKADSAIQPGNAGLIVAGAGWTANADGGDKTAVIGSTATLDTIATALNIVTAGAGTQLENIAQKVKALETALANSLRPNA